MKDTPITDTVNTKTVCFGEYTLTYNHKKKVDFNPNATWQQKIEEWKDKLNKGETDINTYKIYRNHISSLSNRVFSKEEWDEITKNWERILEKLKFNNPDNATEFINNYKKFTGEGGEEKGSLFDKLKERKTNGKMFKQPKAEMYRIIVAYNLDFFCPIVNELNINELLTLLKEGGYVTSIKKKNEEKDATLSNVHWCIKSALIRRYFSEVYVYTDATPWGVYLKLKDTEIKDILKHNQNLILTGAPGTGKTFLAKKLVAQIIGCKDSELENKQRKSQWKFVQFHPSYDYTDFVEGLRPNPKNTSNFERKDGIFKEFCSKALDDWQNTWNNEQNKYTDEKEILKNCKENAPKYVFIIDEINRGEISKIFGELFFSIDPGYRGKDGIVQTQYQNLIKNGESFKDGFYVPENVYIIGTMNDIDRSVESLDFAFRRRFAFYEIKATNDMLDSLEINPTAIVNLKEIMNELNINILEQGLTEAYQIGGAYFKKIEKFYDSNNYNESMFKQATTKLWNLYLQGTLYEYFRGEPDGMEKLDELKKAYFDAVEKNS